MDLANIYSLSEELLEQYRNNPFPDNEVRPGMKEYAQKFKSEIINLPTPYVMALEGGYGVGKTYFITRFCEYLKKSNFEDDMPIEAIYLNLWENDYVSNPFPVIAAQIISALNPAHELQESIKQNAIKITNNFLKFGVKVFGGVDIGDVFPDPKQNKEDLKAFKSELQQAISEKGNKVVLVVDELDRCKPDYAVKTLETIKHFFDIDGLLVILTTKLDFMDSIFEAYYGHPKCETHMGEGYIQKFVQSKKIINPTSKNDYLFIINRILNTDSLPRKNTNVGGYPDLNGKFNQQTVNYFVDTMAVVFNGNKLSIRKTIDICNEIKNIINRYYDDIWQNKVEGYPEFIVIKYLKEKHLISNDTPEPEVVWRFPEQLDRINSQTIEMIGKFL